MCQTWDVTWNISTVMMKSTVQLKTPEMNRQQGIQQYAQQICCYIILILVLCPTTVWSESSTIESTAITSAIQTSAIETSIESSIQSTENTLITSAETSEGTYETSSLISAISTADENSTLAQTTDFPDNTSVSGYYSTENSTDVAPISEYTSDFTEYTVTDVTWTEVTDIEWSTADYTDTTFSLYEETTFTTEEPLPTEESTETTWFTSDITTFPLDITTLEETGGNDRRRKLAIGLGTTFGILGAVGIAAVVFYFLKRSRNDAPSNYANLQEDGSRFNNPTYEGSGQGNDGFNMY